MRYFDDKTFTCPCMYKYYNIDSEPQCQPCYKYCYTCSGPEYNDCLSCYEGDNRELDDG